MIVTRRLTLVWVLLLGLTFASFVVGIEQGAGVASAAAVVIIGLAMYKVRLIGIHFMDLRVAPRPLRLLFEAYVLAVFTTLATLDLVVS
jgi:Prokaryotic Cytochrome C oxidase subunit IV